MNKLYSWIEQQTEHSTRKMVATLGVSQSGYYQWKKAEPGKLKATIAHELVHQHHFLNERLFSQPLGQSEKEAYEFVIKKADRLDLSKEEIEQQKVLLNKVLKDWKSGDVPGYAKPVVKPENFEKWKFLLK